MLGREPVCVMIAFDSWSQFSRGVQLTDGHTVPRGKRVQRCVRLPP